MFKSLPGHTKPMQTPATSNAHALSPASAAVSGQRSATHTSARRWPGRFFAGLLLLLLPCLAMLLMLPWLLHSAWAQQAAQHWLQTRYQRTLQLEEPWQIRWQGGDRLHLLIKGLSLSEAASPQTMLQLEELSMQLKLLPLLQQRLELAEVQVRGAHFVLRRERDGRLNIADLLPDPEAPPSPWRASLTRLMLKDARLSWQDQLSARQLDLTLAELSLGPLAENAQGELNLSATLRSDWPLAAELRTQALSLRLRSHYELDTGAQRLLLQDVQGQLALTAAQAQENQPERHWQVELQASHMRLAPDHWQARQLNLQLSAAAGLCPGWPAFTSQLTLTRLEHDASALKLPEFAMHLRLQQETLRLESRLSGQLDWQWPSRQLSVQLQQLNAQLQHARLKQPLPLMARADLHLELPAASPPATRPIQARLQLVGELAHGPAQMALSYGQGRQPRARLNIDARLARLNLDDWLQADAGPHTASVTPKTASPDQRPPLPFALDGRLHVDALTLAGTRLKGVDFTAQAIDNWLQGFR